MKLSSGEARLLVALTVTEVLMATCSSFGHGQHGSDPLPSISAATVAYHLDGGAVEHALASAAKVVWSTNARNALLTFNPLETVVAVRADVPSVNLCAKVYVVSSPHD